MKEVKTAHGFVLDGEPRFVDLTYRDQDTPVVTFDEEWQNNRQKIKVTVLKKERIQNVCWKVRFRLIYKRRYQRQRWKSPDGSRNADRAENNG